MFEPKYDFKKLTNEEPIEDALIILANAVAQPGTMMIKLSNTSFTVFAMF